MGDVNLVIKSRDRRKGLDRRQFSYAEVIPERRSGKERRSGVDRRKIGRLLQALIEHEANLTPEP
jgi:hypothetical protein